MPEAFGLNDELIEEFGLDDEEVGQSAVTQPMIPGGQKVFTAQARTPTAASNTAYQPKMAPTHISGSQANMGMDPNVANYSQNELAAAQSGVDIDTHAPGRFGAGFGDPLFAFKGALTKKLGYEPDMRQGPLSGQIEYQVRGSNRWITTGEPYPVADIMTGVGATTLGAGGAVLGAGGGPAGSAFVGGGMATIGAAGGRSLSNWIGKKAGYLPDDADVYEGAQSAAEATAVGELATFGLLGLGKGARWIFKGSKPFNATEATELLNSMKSADRLVEDIKAGSGTDFKLTGYQIASGPDSGVRSARSTTRAGQQQGIAESDPKVGPKLEADFQQQQIALTEYFKNLIGKARQENFAKQESGEAIADALFDPYEVARKAAQEAIAKFPPDVPEEAAASVIRTSIEAAKKEWDTTVTQPKWQAYKDAIGYDMQKAKSNVQIPWSPEARALDKAWRAERIASKKQTGGALEQKAPNFKIPKTKNSKILDADGKPLTSGAEPTIDLNILTGKIQDLRDSIRKSLSGDTGIDRSNVKYSALEKALTKMRDNYLEENNKPVKDLLDAAEAATKQGYTKFDRGVTRDMLVMGKNGSMRLSNGQTMADLLKSDDLESIRAFADNVKSYPEAKDQVNQVLYSLYRKDYTKNGIPTPALQKKFNKDYEKVMDVFFSPEDKAKIQQMGGLANKVGEEFIQLRKMMPKLKGSMGGDVETVGPDRLIDNMFSKSWTPKQVDYALGALKDYPYKDSVIKQWQAGAAEEMYKRLLDRKSGDIVINKVDTLLAGDSAEKLEKLFNAGGSGSGTKLVAGLKNLREASILAQTRGIGGLTPSQATALTDLQRITYARPLSREGLLVSALGRSRKRAGPERIYKALTDPAEMERLSNQIDSLRSQLVRASMVGSLPAYSDPNDE